MIIILLGGVCCIMFQKIAFIIRNQLFNLSNEDLIYKCLDQNILISTLACEELLKRDLNDLKVDDTMLSFVVYKLTIEQVWELVLKNNNKLARIAYQRLNEIFEYYQNLNKKEYLEKLNEDVKEYLYLIKKK